jgi:hypothetical protein
VCRSTATGEVPSFGESYDTSMWLRKIWLELTGRGLKSRLVVDSMGAVKSIITIKLPAEKRFRIELAVILQGLRQGHLESTWVPNRSNLSDPFTKEADSEAFRLRPSEQMKRPLFMLSATITLISVAFASSRRLRRMCQNTEV